MRLQSVFRWLTLIFALILACIILVANLDLAPALLTPVYAFPNGDKLAHFLLTGTLSLLVSLSFPNRRFIGMLVSVIFLGLLVTFEEGTQIFLANRNFSLRDLAANYAGILLFGELGAAVRRIMRY